MKKLLALTLALLMTAALLPLNLHTASADTSGQCGDNLYWSFSESAGILTITGSGPMWNYSSSSDQPWASIRSEITKVEVQDGVTSIGGYAFSGCTSLSEITIPDSVTSIGHAAFSGCTGLQSFTIPNSVTGIAWYTFYGCTGLTEVTIPDSVTSIEFLAFSGCRGLRSVTIPDSVTNIGECAFSGCTGLTSLTMPCSLITYTSDSLNYVYSIFSGCSSLEYVHLTAGTGYMPSYAGSYSSGSASPTYYGWQFTPWYISESDNLTIILDDGIRYIGARAFQSCSGLTEITIPDSVNKIGSGAFYKCSSLTSVDLGEGLNDIDNSAFAYCAGLTSIVIPDSVTTIGQSAFSNSTLSVITLGKQVAAIESGAFGNCSDLNDVYYHGTERMRNSISISSVPSWMGSNTNLTDAVWHYALLRHLSRCK